MSNKIKIDYLHETSYSITALNAVGATTSTTLRTLSTISGDTYYVKKWGTDYAIGDITNAVIDTPRSDGGGVNEWTFEFWGWNGTSWVSMGSVQDSTGASQAFSDGSAFAATKIKIICTCDGGAVTITDGDTITLTTNIDAGGLSIVLSGEGNEYTFDAAWGTLTWYLSASGSTYYDESYMYGGGRHTPTGSTKYSYFHPNDAYDVCGANDGVVVLDSEYYQIDAKSLSQSDVVIQSALGQTPTFCTIIGSSVYRDQEHQDNNDTTAYVSSSGDDVGGDGTYQNPYATHDTAFTNIGTRTWITTMDAATFQEDIVLDAAVSLEPLYGIVPILLAANLGSACVNITHGSVNIYGYTINYSYFGVNINGAITYSGTIKNNICYNNINGIYMETITEVSGNIINNKLYNNSTNGLYINRDAGVTMSGVISKNIIYNNITGIYINHVFPLSGYVTNNICYNNTNGIYYNNGGAGAHTGSTKNNLLFNNTYGFRMGSWGADSIELNGISINNTTYDLYKHDEGAVTLTYVYYYTNSGFTIGANNINGTDPKLCKTTIPYKLGISSLLGYATATSPYHSDSASNNRGIMTHGYSIAADNITFNGIIFNGLNSYCHAILKYGTSDYTGTTIKWCTLLNFQGMSIDIFDNDTDLDVTISNCKFYDNGQGIALAYGGNSITYSLFYNNSKISIWIDQIGHTINHCSMYGSEYDLYIDSNSGNNIIKNSIFTGSGLYAIYSEVAQQIIYSCNTDANNIYVDISVSSNITDDPLFVNSITPGGEDFHLKCNERGYIIESPCLDVADDSYDMGCYLETRVVEADDWKTYTVSYNPRNLDEILSPKGVINNEDALGNLSNWANHDRLIIPLEWANNSVSNETQLKKIRYLHALKPTPINELTEENCKQRIYLLVDDKYGSGTGVINASALTLNDATKNWVENEKLGWHVTIIYETELTGTVNATTKVITKIGAGWTPDAWIGYYFTQNNNYYYILDNDATTLTVSDAHNYLVDSASETINIVKMFKIRSNDETILTLIDNNSELITGSYSYYIDFILCRPQQGNFEARQAVYKYNKWETKSGYKITYEDVD